MSESYRYETLDSDGTGPRRHRVYPMPPVARDYWAAVTDVPCPVCDAGMVRWAEAGYGPGYRVCDACGRHYQAQGTSGAPALARLRRQWTAAERAERVRELRAAADATARAELAEGAAP